MQYNADCIFSLLHGTLWSSGTLRASDFPLGIIKMPNEDLAVGRLADMLGRAFYGIGEQNKSGGSFNGID